jgi:hypothetical protein
MMEHHDCCPSMKIWKGIALLVVAFLVLMWPAWNLSWPSFFALLIALLGLKKIIMGIKYSMYKEPNKKRK